MGFLSDIWKQILDFFVSTENEPNYNNSSYTREIRTRNYNKKKFEINGETYIDNLSSASSSNNFRVITKSRPRSCERCNSKGTIIKLGNKWHCSTDRNGCGHSWG